MFLHYSSALMPGDEGSEINGRSSQKSGSAQSGNEVVLIILARGALSPWEREIYFICTQHGARPFFISLPLSHACA
jgi:hypothetical protein